MNILSDFNSSKKHPIRVASSELYSDFALTQLIHPTRNDLVVVSDISAVKNSIRNLVLTSSGERPFQPKLGGGIRRLLFENADFLTQIRLTDEITNTIIENEPRVRNVVVDVVDNSDENSYSISITFEVLHDTSDNVEFTLNRLR